VALQGACVWQCARYDKGLLLLLGGGLQFTFCTSHSADSHPFIHAGLVPAHVCFPLQAHPHITAVNCDLPAVHSTAVSYVEQHGMKDKVQVRNPSLPKAYNSLCQTQFRTG
jgi:hypothetical protein